VALVALAVTAAVGSFSPALAETYSFSGVCVGTNGSDAGNGGGCGLFPAVAVSQGGCAEGTLVAVAAGESGRCPYYGSEATAPVALGLVGADSLTWGYFMGVVVSDSGDAISNGSHPGIVLVSGTGNAYGSSGTAAVSVSGTGTAWGATAVSGTGTAEGVIAVSGTGSASGGAVAVAGGDATAYGGLVCVSATGDCHGASVYNACPMGYCE
jgi:hypothetical protein